MNLIAGDASVQEVLRLDDAVEIVVAEGHPVGSA